MRSGLRRLEYWSEIKKVKTENLVFLDEMGVLLGLMRTRARSLKGQRAYDLKPFYRGKRLTVIGAMTHDGCLGIKTLSKGMNGEDFQQFLKEELAPKLWSGAVQSLSAQVQRLRLKACFAGDGALAPFSDALARMRLRNGQFTCP